jgi:Tol biopolymer transport system component
MRVASARLEIADVDAQSLLVGGRLADTDLPSLWRYDMRTAQVTQPFANPPGTCLGCHIAVSSDGARIAAGMIAPGVPELEGVVFDARTGAQLATSSPMVASPWATATFDPSGALVTGWQGALSVRDAQTGTVRATIATEDPASAPAISADGRQLAYVTLDAGFGSAASQPAGNALRIRSFTAAGASVGPPIELVRDGGGVEMPVWSSDGRWIAYGRTTIDPTRVGGLPIGSSAVRTDGSGTIFSLTADPRDQLARWASPVTIGHVGGRPAEPIVWVAFASTRTGTQQLWLEAFFPDRGDVAPAFHLPGQPATFAALHGPLALP